MDSIEQRLQLLREEMRREHLSAFIFPSADAHGSEYTPDHWKGREWVSGFNGSAGTAVVTMSSAALWTDSRYFLAAEEQLRGTEFQLMRLKMDGTPTIAEWLGRELAGDDRREVGVDGLCVSRNEALQLEDELRWQGGITLRTNLDILSRVWAERPPLPSAPVVLHPLAYSGEEAADKLARLRHQLRLCHADGMMVSALDDIAWLLNLRGTDVHCTPLFVAYLLVESGQATLFIKPEKVSTEVASYLRGLNIHVEDYDAVAAAFDRYGEYNLLLDPNETSAALYQRAVRARPQGRDLHIVDAPSPLPAMKVVKNEVEQQGYRRAMERDGVAMVRFLMWLESVQGPVTELDIDRKLTSLRAEQDLFRDISFDTIAAYGPHAAVVHYEPTPETNIALQPKGFLLLDSGAQYLDATTDITRTIALGPLTDEERRVYTLVLKGHLRLQNLKFPDGASGTQLDAVAREPLWNEGLNFLHGTGHGVGSYLSVHEGQHQVRMEWKPAPLRAGMTLTDEPGIYLPGRFGVRIENTLLIRPWRETDMGRFLQFEPLTLCPIDRRPIVGELLSDEERQWLDDYHALVLRRLSPLLRPEERDWLAEACRPLD
jgi:Xaa-Pro aminopeptidase